MEIRVTFHPFDPEPGLLYRCRWLGRQLAVAADEENEESSSNTL